MMRPPDDLPDPRSAKEIVEDGRRADEFAVRGSVKHLLLRLGFFPNDESDAEAMLERIVRENEWWAR